MKGLVKCVEVAHLLQFRVNSLEPITAKAKKLLKYRASKKRHDGLEVKVQEIQREIAAAQSEMDTALGDEDFKSILGIDCQA